MRIVGAASSIVSIPHILAETSNLIRQTAEPMCSQIMAVFRTVITNIDEVHMEAAIAARADVFIPLGLTDAAIASLTPSNLVVLTVDHDLHLVASRAGFEVLNMTPLFHET